MSRAVSEGPPFSILDLVPVTEGSEARVSFANMLELARLGELKKAAVASLMEVIGRIPSFRSNSRGRSSNMACATFVVSYRCSAIARPFRICPSAARFRTTNVRFRTPAGVLSTSMPRTTGA